MSGQVSILNISTISKKNVTWVRVIVWSSWHGLDWAELMSVMITLKWHVTMGSWGSRQWPAPCDHYQTNVLNSYHKYMSSVKWFICSSSNNNVCHENINKRESPLSEHEVLLWAWQVLGGDKPALASWLQPQARGSQEPPQPDRGLGGNSVINMEISWERFILSIIWHCLSRHDGVDG